MLELMSYIEGKEAKYGRIKKPFEQEGFSLNGGWEYDRAHFDAIVSQDGGETIYLRLPVHVIAGKLDHDDARLKFGAPFLIKHIVHTGFVEDDLSIGLLNIAGLNQFQPPLERDGHIEDEDKWREVGEAVLNRLQPFVH